MADVMEALAPGERAAVALPLPLAAADAVGLVVGAAVTLSVAVPVPVGVVKWVPVLEGVGCPMARPLLRGWACWRA